MNKPFYLSVDIGIKNLGFCLYNGDEIHFGVYGIDPVARKKYLKEYGIVIARIKVAEEWFRDILDRFDVEKVVVEKQVPKNTIARVLEATILSLAVANGIDVRGYSALEKFSYEKDFKCNFKTKEHKKISVVYARNILKKFGYSLDYFDTHAKRDDLGDSICMCVFTRIEEKNKNRNFIIWLIK